MRLAASILGPALILLVLWEGFESFILPRRVTRRFRLTRVFYRCSWRLWSFWAVRFFPLRLRETLLSFFGPLSVLLLLSMWACGLIIGFALLHWGIYSALRAPEGALSLFSFIYFSCTTFFTLGIGDLTPVSLGARLLTMAEAGMGMGFLALIISYLPPLNQSFARREVSISLLDSRAGSPPTAAEMLIRHSNDQAMESLKILLHDWEHWSAELLEGHLSYPVLAYFRSQHDNQSWLGALTAILDTCSLVRATLEDTCTRQAELTFAMARHAVVDLSLVFRRPPEEPKSDRLSPELFAALKGSLVGAGLRVKEGDEALVKLTELRLLYEPYVHGLARYFLLDVPPWFIAQGGPDNWQVSVWEKAGAAKKGWRGPSGKKKAHF